MSKHTREQILGKAFVAEAASLQSILSNALSYLRISGPWRQQHIIHLVAIGPHAKVNAIIVDLHTTSNWDEQPWDKMLDLHLFM